MNNKMLCLMMSLFGGVFGEDLRPRTFNYLDSATYILHNKRVKARDLIKELERQGWFLARIRGSHHIFSHADSGASVTVPIHGKEIADHLAKGIIRQAKQALDKE